ncbi:MAG TPA: ShlB/FhaC/HecB family hemolysin secretion/activation protein [Kiritimatiellia bacterium]|nr:ShlB/FhaC/HecB family hemolysin secretion/activation protein [Kiritimatiellia bacterium]HRU70758.1 ShlB/FhaC/HecB family hemolysin secretion/activation protein [Kiritimatiellia bacterium]
MCGVRPLWLYAVVGASVLCAMATCGGWAKEADREKVASALEQTGHRRLDVKAGLRFFQLVAAFDEATNAVAVQASEYMAATEQLEALDAEHAAMFNLEPAKRYLYERSTGKLFRLEVQSGKPPKVVRILDRKLTQEEGRAYLAAQGARLELIARQQAAAEKISEQEEAASQAVAALKTEFGVEPDAWADLYLLPGRKEVVLVQGRYPAKPSEPMVPTKSGEIPPEALWIYGVDFILPEGSGPVLSRLRDALGNLVAGEQRDVSFTSQEWGTESVAISDLAMLLKGGQVSVEDGRTLRVRARSFNGALVSRDSVVPAVSNLLNTVRESGYYMVGLGQALQPPTNGVLAVKLDAGRVGDVNVAFIGQTNETGVVASEGKWYSGEQIKRRFYKSAPGQPFDYNALYNALWEANENQDLAVNTDVKVRQVRGEDGSVARTADLTLEVQESRPIHGSVEIGNDGSAQSGNWWLGGTLRHQNLTRHDDVLSVEAQTALEDSSLYAVSGSYMLPHYWKHGGALSLYAGYSELDINNLIPGIGVNGLGKYAGLRLSQRLLDTRDHQIELAVGQTYRYVEENLVFDGYTADTRDATIAPYYLQLSWQQKRLDALGGRTFAMAEVSHNVGGWMGTSRDDDMQRMRVGADADYTIERVQFARLQAVSGLDTLDDRLESRWTLFVRGVGQFSQDPLVSLEQLGIGGAATVRGYEERELLGDQGAYASVELRTPTLSGILPASLRWFNSGSEWQVLDRLQLLVFLDAGWVRVIDSLPGEDDDTFMLSLGPGLRYALSRHALLRLDWGFPLEETVESDRTGRGHLNFQLQF